MNRHHSRRPGEPLDVQQVWFIMAFKVFSELRVQIRAPQVRFVPYHYESETISFEVTAVSMINNMLHLFLEYS